MKNELFTIGHSNHSLERFIELLLKHSISVVCDVRSTPYSKYAPQFNRELIQIELKKHNISYVYLGKELGPRSDNKECYINGKVQYNSLAKQPTFIQGLERLREGITKYRIALMCAEKDPIECHRTILVCRNLRSDNFEIKHILEDGKIEHNRELEGRLAEMLKLNQRDLFITNQNPIERAYDIQGEKIAYVNTVDNNNLSSEINGKG